MSFMQDCGDDEVTTGSWQVAGTQQMVVIIYYFYQTWTMKVQKLFF